MVAPDLRFRVSAGDNATTGCTKSRQVHVMPEETPKPRGIAGHVSYFVQDLILTNLHWVWLTGLIGSLLVYGIFSRAFLFNLAFTLLPHLFPGSAKRRFHHFQRWVLGEFLRDAKVLAHAPPASYTTGRRCLFGIAPHGALPIGFWPLSFVAHDVFRKCAPAPL